MHGSVRGALAPTHGHQLRSELLPQKTIDDEVTRGVQHNQQVGYHHEYDVRWVRHGVRIHGINDVHDQGRSTAHEEHEHDTQRDDCQILLLLLSELKGFPLLLALLQGPYEPEVQVNEHEQGNQEEHESVQESVVQVAVDHVVRHVGLVEHVDGDVTVLDGDDLVLEVARDVVRDGDDERDDHSLPHLHETENHKSRYEVRTCRIYLNRCIRQGRRPKHSDLGKMLSQWSPHSVVGIRPWMFCHQLQCHGGLFASRSE